MAVYTQSMIVADSIDKYLNGIYAEIKSRREGGERWNENRNDSDMNISMQLLTHSYTIDKKICMCIVHICILVYVF